MDDSEGLVRWGLGLLVLAIIYGVILHFAVKPTVQQSYTQVESSTVVSSVVSSEMVSSDNMVDYTARSEETISTDTSNEKF